MSTMISNQAFNIVTESELATVLSHYSTEFVISVLEEALQKKYTELPIVQLPNVVYAWEANFKMIMEQYQDLPESREEVMRVRSQTYIEIIDKICKEFGLEFTTDENVDLYTAASALYNFFVCDFSNSMVRFYGNYIFREKNNIYEFMNLAELKKNKDSSTIYGKKVFKDTKIAVINANIDMVITNLSNMDITLSDVFDSINDTNTATFMKSIVSTQYDFYKNFYVKLMNGMLRPDYLTSIRLYLQTLSEYNTTTWSLERDHQNEGV